MYCYSKNIKVTLVAALVLVTAACTEGRDPVPVDGSSISGYGGLYSESNVKFIRIWVDPATRCNYIINTLESNTIPRLDRNGKPMCGTPGESYSIDGVELDQ